MRGRRLSQGEERRACVSLMCLFAVSLVSGLSELTFAGQVAKCARPGVVAVGVCLGRSIIECPSRA